MGGDRKQVKVAQTQTPLVIAACDEVGVGCASYFIALVVVQPRHAGNRNCTTMTWTMVEATYTRFSIFTK